MQYVTGSRAGTQDYSVGFAPCQEVRGKFGHITSLEGPLASYVATLASSPSCTEYDTVPSDPTSPRNEHIRNCSLGVAIDVPALTNGAPTLIARASGPTAQQLDWGMTDTRVSNFYIKPSRMYGSTLTGVCPLNYFSDSIRLALEPKLGLWFSTSGLKPSTFTPACGSLSIDIDGTAQGLWVQTSEADTGPVQESAQLVMAPHFTQPDKHTFGVGTTLPGVRASSYHFVVKTSGLVNRRFSDIVASGGSNSPIHCYEAGGSNFLANTTMPFTQSFLVRKNADGTVTVQGRGSTACGAGPWTFGANAKNYKR
jgi:hypothetical protein